MSELNFITEVDVMFYDTDIGGVIHNLAYLRMIEENRTKLAIKIGMDLQSMQTNGVFPVLLNTNANYIKPGTLGDTLVIIGKVSKIERVKFKCNFEVYRKSDNTLLVNCEQFLAVVKMPEGKPQRLPKELLNLKK